MGVRTPPRLAKIVWSNSPKFKQNQIWQVFAVLPHAQNPLLKPFLAYFHTWLSQSYQDSFSKEVCLPPNTSSSILTMFKVKFPSDLTKMTTLLSWSISFMFITCQIRVHSKVTLFVKAKKISYLEKNKKKGYWLSNVLFCLIYDHFQCSK